MEAVFICACKTGFSEIQYYVDHIRQCRYLRSIEGLKEKIECAVCHKRVSTVYYFRSTHINFHEVIKKFTCDQCDTRFAIHSDLISHKKKKHTMEKNIQCPNCGMCFATSSERSSHLRVHSTEKKFCCQICAKKFVRSSILEQHMRTHTGERPFTCTKCDKKFTQKSSLIKHERTHKWDWTGNSDVYYVFNYFWDTHRSRFLYLYSQTVSIFPFPLTIIRNIYIPIWIWLNRLNVFSEKWFTDHGSNPNNTDSKASEKRSHDEEV